MTPRVVTKKVPQHAAEDSSLRVVKTDDMLRVVSGKNKVLICNGWLCRWLFPKDNTEFSL